MRETITMTAREQQRAHRPHMSARMTRRLGGLAVLNMAVAVLAPGAALAADHPTNRADNMVGTQGDDVLSSKGGRDIMHGRGGSDTLSGGAKGDKGPDT